MSDLPPTPPETIPDGRLRQYAWIAVAIAVALAVWGNASRANARNESGRRTAGATACPLVVGGTPRAATPRKKPGRQAGGAAATTVVTVKPTVAPGSEA